MQFQYLQKFTCLTFDLLYPKYLQTRTSLPKMDENLNKEKEIIYS